MSELNYKKYREDRTIEGCHMLLYYEDWYDENRDNPKAMADHGNTILHVACEVGDDDLVLQYIKEGRELDPKCDLGYTPLMSAMRTGSHYCAYLLIRNGADIDVVGDGGECALTKLFRSSLDIGMKEHLAHKIRKRRCGSYERAVKAYNTRRETRRQQNERK